MARATKRLSARTVETITNLGYHADGDGLYLVVDRSGARRWAVIFHAQGKRREMGLGRMGLIKRRARRPTPFAVRPGTGSIPSWRANRPATQGRPFRPSRRLGHTQERVNLVLIGGMPGCVISSVN